MDKHERNSGLLLHITSLPSYYGIGDFGPSAYAFADFLADAGQKYWQILPLTTVEGFSGYSPYTGVSVFAGNTLLISPELMYQRGMISLEDLEDHPDFNEEQVDYNMVEVYKENLFQKAYDYFVANDLRQDPGFITFCEKHALWLDDYAIYITMKKNHNLVSWVDWPPAIRDRKPAAMKRAKVDFAYSIEREKFLQYIFYQQWEDLKNYCNSKDIKLFGDISFYVNHDSVDVWCFREYFKLDENLQPQYVSGVPPDYFSSTGQLWGTPVYRWETLHSDKYTWWIDRITHNLSMFDLLRLDHFRAFSAYWEVPAGDETAINGKWVESPGYQLFKTLAGKYPKLPLVAEDLGTIDQPVRDLMNDFDLPGMKLLLFAFGEDMSTNPYVPHNHIYNCIVYTGTHDNNSARGWFDEEATEADRARLSSYLNQELTSENISDTLVHLALMSVAKLVILPVQDVLGLGSESIMNKPAVHGGNWKWRVQAHQLNPEVAEKLKEMTMLYGRYTEDVKEEVEEK